MKVNEDDTLIKEPKFKVGDKVKNDSIKDLSVCTIESVDDTVYYCDCTNFDIKDQDQWELVEEPVSEGLEKASYRFACKCHPLKTECSTSSPNPEVMEAFKAGAKWQKNNLWKPADGDDLPIFDREVIALEGIIDQTATDCFCGYKVVFAHRPTTEGYDGKSIVTGEVEHYTPKTYGEGGWNVPNIAYWLDCSMPKEIEL